MYSWRVPLRASGKLLVVASQDLGGLGAKDGPAAEYIWVPGSLLPPALPWLAIFGFLMLKRNRALAAWWIWVPLAGGLALEPMFRVILGWFPNQPLDLFLQTLKGAIFATAAVWLIAGYLGWKHRFLSFLGIWGTASGFGLFTVGVAQWEDWNTESTFALIATLIACFNITATLMLSGLFSRRRYGALRLFVNALASILVVSGAISGVLLALMWALTHGQMMVGEFFAGMAVLTGIGLGALLPFLLLTCANHFYRERIKDLLHLGVLETPPVIPPIPEVEAAGAVEEVVR